MSRVLSRFVSCPWTFLSVFVYRVLGRNQYLTPWTSISVWLLNLQRCLITVSTAFVCCVLGVWDVSFIPIRVFFSVFVYCLPVVWDQQVLWEHAHSTLCYGSSFYLVTRAWNPVCFALVLVSRKFWSSSFVESSFISFGVTPWIFISVWLLSL